MNKILLGIINVLLAEVRWWDRNGGTLEDIDRINDSVDKLICELNKTLTLEDIDDVDYALELEHASDISEIHNLIIAILQKYISYEDLIDWIKKLPDIIKRLDHNL
jgi:hypothetical protein